MGTVRIRPTPAERGTGCMADPRRAIIVPSWPVATASTVRVRNGKSLVTDGPFAETKEQLGGFYLVEAESLDDALAMAARIPGARYGSVEVRPVMPIPGR